MTEKNSPDQTQTPEQASSDNSEAKGIRARLTAAQRAMLASKSRGGDSGLQSVGKNHKPTHASGKQGPVEKKVRW